MTYYKMRVRIVRSPNKIKKFRAKLEDGTVVDFGASGYSNYTKHKNPSRMRAYVRRHGGYIPTSLSVETNPVKIQSRMLKINRSDKENWGLNGIGTPGFWARWYLWSYPSFAQVDKFMKRKFGITILR